MAEMKQEVKTKEARVFSGNINTFAELMEEVATLTEEQQEKLSFYIQGYVAAGRAQREKMAV